MPRQSLGTHLGRLLLHSPFFNSILSSGTIRTGQSPEDSGSQAEPGSQSKKQEVIARSLLCFWAVRELGLSLTELARHLEMSLPGVDYAVRRGERIARENHYHSV